MVVQARNPILPGFHPDPCIVAHDGWYYVATSTFQWWPGVQINRSRDCANWELAGYALTRQSQLDIAGVPDSGGVWAPALSYSDGLFWLVYSDMKSFAGPFKDVRNYLVTAPAIEGPWSDPVYLNRSGFDPSLFHDVDGRKWLLNQNWTPTHDPASFDGIVIQEYLPGNQKLVGEPRHIFAGSPLGTTEGPHVYLKDGYYYLVTAEGGTGWEHAVTVARSRDLSGPYEICPDGPLLTSADDPDNLLQKAGHGSLVQTEGGSWLMAYLCSRPIAGTRRCILGRETALQPIRWPEAEWPKLANGGNTPSPQFEAPANHRKPYFDRFHDDFGGEVLSPHWNTLREPPTADWLMLMRQPQALRLIGRHSIQSLFEVSLVGCRVAHHACDIHTTLQYEPVSLQQRAGLAMYYSATNFYYLYVSAERGARYVGVLACDNGRFREVGRTTLPRSTSTTLELHAYLRGAELTFACGVGDADAKPVGGVFDATTLSDDYPLETGAGWSFTGLFAALCVQDSTGCTAPADFKQFTYEQRSTDQRTT